MTTTSDPDADIDFGKLVGAENEDGLVELRPEDFWGKELEGLAVDPDQALAGHAARDGCESVRGWSERYIFCSKQKFVPVAFFFLPNT